MNCPVCPNVITQQNKTYCSPQCAKLFLSAVREAYGNTMPHQQYQQPQQRTYTNVQRQPYQPRTDSNPLGFAKTSYQDLLKQNQEQLASMTITNKCKNSSCQNQTDGNNLYCNTHLEADDGKCKKCNVNDRNMPHPICSDCHKMMKDKPKDPNKKPYQKQDSKEKKVSKYDKNKVKKEQALVV